MWCASFVPALLLLAAAAPNKQASGGSQFALWQRYGRGASALLPPRADRFFMTSRYGKRMESVQDGGLPLPYPDGDRWADGHGPASDDLQCQYIGIGDLYRCRTTNEQNETYDEKSETAATLTTIRVQ